MHFHSKQDKSNFSRAVVVAVVFVVAFFVVVTRNSNFWQVSMCITVAMHSKWSEWKREPFTCSFFIQMRCRKCSQLKRFSLISMWINELSGYTDFRMLGFWMVCVCVCGRFGKIIWFDSLIVTNKMSNNLANESCQLNAFHFAIYSRWWWCRCMNRAHYRRMLSRMVTAFAICYAF